MLARAAIQRIIPILKQGCGRALRMKVRGFPKAYYCSFLLRDTEWFNTWAGSGSTYRTRSDRTRNVYCDLRVGSPRYDQVTDGGLKDNSDETESYQHIRVPIDDRVYDGLRLGLWRLTESKFREALADFNQREAVRLTKIDPTSHLSSFSGLKPLTALSFERAEKVDQNKWVTFCRKMSRWMARLPYVSSSYMEFDASQQTKIFVSSENRVVVQHERVFSLMATLTKLTKEGINLEQELIINCGTQAELPNIRTFKKLVREKHEKLLKLVRARRIHAFSGPVLLYPGPAGVLFHEAIGHRLEGSRLLSVGEGQTFKGQVSKPILGIALNVSDNPKLKRFKGIKCIGAYDFDDEGTPTRNTSLVEGGVLKDFLTTRAECLAAGFALNGHARNSKHQRPVSRMGVTIVEGQKGYSVDKLKELLIKELRRQKKPFGLIVYETSGGETETANYDFQAFSGNISYATLLYADGSEEPVQGVNFVGTPLQALSNIVAVGDTPQIDNGYCGAESGMVPVTTICPAILLSSLELQAKDEEFVTQYILPRPRL